MNMSKAFQESLLRDQTRILRAGPDAAWEAMNFASKNQFEKGIDIPALQELVLQGKEPKSLYLFATNVENADINAIQEAFLNCAHYAEDVFGFATQVRGADIIACMSVAVELMTESDNPIYNQHLEAWFENLQECFPNVMTKEVIAELTSGVTL